MLAIFSSDAAEFVAGVKCMYALAGTTVYKNLAKLQFRKTAHNVSVALRKYVSRQPVLAANSIAAGSLYR